MKRMQASKSLCIVLLLLSWHHVFPTVLSLVGTHYHAHRLQHSSQQISSSDDRNNPQMMRHYRFSVLKVKDNDQDFFRDDDLEDEEEYTVDYTKFESFFDDNHHLDEQIDYGKFERDSKMLEDEQEESPLLPKFLTNDNHDDDDDDDSDDETQTTWTTQLSSTEKMMQRRMEEQQQQIDLLMKLVQQQQHQQQPLVAPPLPSFETLPSSATTSIITPLKAMLFIDGTWLYYSIHERNEQKCPIIHKYGRGWQTRYQFDWTALSRVICEQLRLQETLRHQQRHVEITRSSVYTSCKRDTSRYSNRVRMFQDMQAANYDVFMMETVGPGEKCVDIQLAVEMLHYATTANAYDVAILLSGDKDFLPALLRIRQKGRKVAIVAFRNGCNRALYETPNVKDYDMIWMDDFLDQLIIPKTTTTTGGGTAQQVSIFTITKVIHDFIDKSGLPRVSSRDIGRYLKLKKVNQRSLLDELKKSYGGLYQFLTVSGCFYVVRRNERDSKAAQRIDTTDKTFWAALHEDSELLLLEEAKRAHFTLEEKEFFDNYSLQPLYDDPALYYYHSREMLDSDEPVVIPQELKRDYSQCKVAELKEICRERGLLVSGTKAVLIERIQNDVDTKVLELERQQHASRMKMKRPRITGRINGESNKGRTSTATPMPIDPEMEKYLENLVKEYIQAGGGQASSRDIGRYLAANSVSGGQGTALSELKRLYGGLSAFICNHPDSFRSFNDDSTDATLFEFKVALKQ